MSYSLTYTVAASTRLEAIEAAVTMLRSGVRLRGVNSAVQAGSVWHVSLNVWEDV